METKKVTLANRTVLEDKRGVEFRLSRIYKAKDCSDIIDCEVAMEAVREIAVYVKLFDYTPSMRRRLASLERKRQQLLLKFK